MATRKQKAKKRAPSPKRDKPVRKRKPGGPKAENPKSAVTRLKAELREALAQQTATADILRTISQSPTDLQPVLDAVVGAARRFCGAPDALIFLREEGEEVIAAHDGKLTASLGLRRPVAITSLTGRAMIEGRTLQIEDIATLDPAADTASLALAGQHKWRASAVAPMMREGEAIGSIVLRKPEPGLLAPHQVQLLETFAAQAVIAIENVRLFTELRESLEQQTATAEVLRVISQSPTDVKPVLDVVLDAALQFCGASDVMISLRQDDEVIVSAHKGPLERTELVRFALDGGHLSSRVILSGETLHVPDIAALDPAEFAGAHEMARRYGWKAAIAAPMMREGVAGGVILLRKPEVGEFTPRQIELLETFAAQAVIAIENVRLFTELRDSLEQQTATAEILRVISQSPTNVQPVLEAVAKAAVRFCGAADAAIGLRDGDSWVATAHEGGVGHIPGHRSPLNRETAAGRSIIEGVTCHLSNIVALDPVEFAGARRMAVEHGFGAVVAAPLLRDGVAIGTVILRKVEPEPFTQPQIAMLETFAAQGVIAIENVRLFSELREALEQQTASAEILQVISQSPTDVAPVLTAVAKAAIRFCNSPDAVIWLRDADEIMRVAHEGPLPTDIGARRPLSRNSAVSLAVAESRTIHYPDLLALDPVKFADAQKRARESDYRAALAAPMLREGQAIGAIVLRKQEAVAYTERQIELLEAFAAQAVIAIENVRLFTELRDSLERLKAAQANLIQAEKMASLGQLTAGIAHEIKNPLNFVNNFAGLSVELLDELKQAAAPVLVGMSEDARGEFGETVDLISSNLEKIAEHGKRADGIVKSMLSHSRGGTGDWQESNINALVEDALNLAYHGARAQDSQFNIALQRDFAAGTQPIEVVPQDVTRVFLNLFGNGFYAAKKRQLSGAGGDYRPTVTVSTRDLGEVVEIRVRDNGTGIPTEARAKLFQPFFTTKPTGEGTGLGLSISYDIVKQQHGGSIDVESEPGSFTEFTVRLPRRRRAA